MVRKLVMAGLLLLMGCSGASSGTDASDNPNAGASAAADVAEADDAGPGSVPDSTDDLPDGEDSDTGPSQVANSEVRSACELLPDPTLLQAVTGVAWEDQTYPIEALGGYGCNVHSVEGLHKYQLYFGAENFDPRTVPDLDVGDEWQPQTGEERCDLTNDFIRNPAQDLQGIEYRVEPVEVPPGIDGEAVVIVFPQGADSFDFTFMVNGVCGDARVELPGATDNSRLPELIVDAVGRATG